MDFEHRIVRITRKPRQYDTENLQLDLRDSNFQNEGYPWKQRDKIETELIAADSKITERRMVGTVLIKVLPSESHHRGAAEESIYLLTDPPA